MIPGTPFTTATVNADFRTAAHTDTGNRRPGLEVLVVLEGRRGGELIFPRYRLAVDARPGDLLLADMRELHGNAPLKSTRLTLVLYALSRMRHCGGS